MPGAEPESSLRRSDSVEPHAPPSRPLPLRERAEARAWRRRQSRRSRGVWQRWLRRLHRWTGALAALFLLLLAVTGILINHANELGLDRKPLVQQGLRALYGLPPAPLVLQDGPPGEPVYWSAGVLFLGEAQYELERFRGAVADGPLRVVAGGEQVLLLTPQGDLVERFSRASLPGVIHRIGTGPDGHALLDSSAGLLAAGGEYLEWTARPEGTPVAWSEPVPARDRRATELAGHAPGPSWEQLLLDLHAGRLFGLSGVLLADLTALAVIFLILSGLWTWWSNRRNRPRR